MAQVINTNISSLNAQGNLNRSQGSLQTSLQRLSSGLRINSAKDDAAGLAVSNRFTTQIRGLSQAVRNANDGISLAQTAEGSLAESTNILQRVRELSIQSANATNSASDREALQSEVNQLVSELNRIADTTSFNGLNLLDGSFTQQAFQVGSEANQTVSVDVAGATGSILGINKTNVNNTQDGLDAATSTTSTTVDLSTTAFGGTAVGASMDAAADSLIADQTVTVTPSTGSSTAVVLTDAALSEVSANSVATALSAVSGVSATAGATSGTIDFSGLTGVEVGDDVTFDLVIEDGATTNTQTVTFTRAGGTLIDEATAAITTAVGAVNTGNGNTDITLTSNTANQTATISSASGLNVAVENFNVNDLAQMTMDTTAFTGLAVDSVMNVALGGTYDGDEVMAVNINVDGGTANVALDMGATAGADFAEDFVLAFGTQTVNGITVSATRVDATNVTLTAQGGYEIGLDTLTATTSTGDETFTTTTSTETDEDTAASGAFAIGGAQTAGVYQGQNALGFNLTGAAADTLAFDLTGIDTADATAVGDAFETALRDGQAVGTVGANTGLTYVRTGDSFALSASVEAESDITLNATTDNNATRLAGTNAALTATVSGDTLGAGENDVLTFNTTDTLTSTSVIETSGVTFNSSAITEVGGAGSDSAVATGTLSITLDEGVTIASNIGSSAGGIFTTTAGADAVTTNLGLAATTAGNNVAAQTLTIDGKASVNASILADASASSIAADVNDSSDSTGVVATARTTAEISNLSSDGVVSFSLNGINVSANVTTTGLNALATSINDKTSQTGGITAVASDDGTTLTLTDASGDDISIASFNSSAATDGSSGTAVEVDVSGASGTTVTLRDGGENSGNYDSTVIGGTVEFQSDSTFTVSSDIADTAGGLFTGTASELQASALNDVDSIDISTVAGANSAIDIIDGALANVDSIRADLGAVQNRFESTIANLTTSVENFSAARSRILDTDFAAETANLTKSQILQQASVAMLSQANSLPQLVLSLLQ